jgi:hypothetical protein
MNSEAETRIPLVKVNTRRILIFINVWYLEFKRLLGKICLSSYWFSVFESSLLYMNFSILLNFIKTSLL